MFLFIKKLEEFDCHSLVSPTFDVFLVSYCDRLACTHQQSCFSSNWIGAKMVDYSFYHRYRPEIGAGARAGVGLLEMNFWAQKKPLECM